MKVKLSSDDKCAIDLVLEDRTSSDGNLPNCFGKQTAAIKARVKRVEQLFDTMSQWPVEEPPTTLVASTLKYVKRHAHEVATHPETRKPAAISQMTHRPLH